MSQGRLFSTGQWFMTTVDLRTVIEALVDRWIAAPAHLDLVEAVRMSGALPVYVDMSGALFLRPDCEILCLPDGDSIEAIAVERDPGWRLTAVVVAAEKYPELKPLLPARPPGTGECKWCGGRGRIRIGESDCRRGPICGRCFGLGWLGGAV
jgi:hypothetical protein